ncbi:polysaccharide deacetylase family protein [Croceimicrobium hydrocarbonivorans]|uniref:Lipoprotein n=1 Tax=Croceimicrobium hydrocarbonivorans TaxID=2761580 RepID=A0A7H0VIE7_9FLAO|nr:hypothetical protein [Croceimicrobium hydrocarbonivorans]QNR25495.1 hypothetical protein H4K34_06550 [Croceimicrobium hydrocarbonivorans]
MKRIAGIFLVFMVFLSCGHVKNPQNKSSTEVLSKNQSTFNFDIEYPFIEDDSGFNMAVTFLVDSLKGQLKGLANPDSAQLSLTYKVMNASDKLISIVFTTYLYHGEAYPLPRSVVFNYDLNRKRKVKFSVDDDLNKKILSEIANAVSFYGCHTFTEIKGFRKLSDYIAFSADSLFIPLTPFVQDRLCSDKIVRIARTSDI